MPIRFIDNAHSSSLLWAKGSWLRRGIVKQPDRHATNKHSFALGVTADDTHDYFFGTTQFIEAELAANAAVEKSESAPPERLHLRYATGEAVILGRGLHRLVQLLQRGELENIRPLDRRYAGLLYTGPIISSIVVTRKEVV